MEPQVTVIIIFLNGARYLDEAVASVLGQTFDRWELLLVDDGSTDASPELAQKWAAQFPDRIRCLHHPGRRNLGMSATRNRGLKDARGEFVAFLDVDDVWLPRKLEDQLAIMAAHPEAAMVYGRTEIWYSWTGKEEDRARDHTYDLGVLPDSLVSPPELLILLLENKAQNPTTCSAMIRRSVFARIGGFQDSFRGMFEDQAFFVKLCLEFPVFVSGQCWARYRQHPESCCAQADASGGSDSSRLVLLKWVESYFREKRVSDRRVLAELDRQLQPFRHPTWSRLKKAGQKMIRSWKRRARRFAGG